jgi:hypothetical protein
MPAKAKAKVAKKAVTKKAPVKKAVAKKAPAKKVVTKKAIPAKKSVAAPKPAPGGKAVGDGTETLPWQLLTASGTSEYKMYRDETVTPPALVCQVGSTQLRYDLRCIEDLYAMLKAHGDWMPLGGADEQKPAAEGTVEAWGRSPSNPVGGWYGLKKGLRGRFGVYLPPLLEALGLAELEHNPKNNRMRAI